jgi:flagellar export protein FliJ
MFRFRLERILLYRQRRVDALTREYAGAQSRENAADKAVETLARDLDQSRESAASERDGSLDAAALARQLIWHEALQARQRELEAVAARAKSERKAAYERLLKAWQEREVLLQLKERQRQQWALAEARRERREFDEIGSIQAVLRSEDAMRELIEEAQGAGARVTESD